MRALLIVLLFPVSIYAQGVMQLNGSESPGAGSSMYSRLQNIPGRKITSLNGKWQVIIDPYDFGAGSWAAIWKDQKPKGKTDFYEYSFDDGPQFNVPGDFNSQLPELNFFEGTVWYKKIITVEKKPGTRLFLHFAGVNYASDVYLNSEKLGSHEGGFTPFQFEITDKVKNGSNTIIVRANNQRVPDGLPPLGFDWFNYGGITRDVSLVETPGSYVEDYFIQLKKGSENQVQGWVRLNGTVKSRKVVVEVPEAKVSYSVMTDDTGFAPLSFPAKLTLWSPANPKLYAVTILTATDTVCEMIGFRDIRVEGTNILLNGKSVFLKGISFHEEIPQRKGRAYSEADALQLLTWAKELGCNFVRLAHYPQNEHTVRMAEKMGLLLWEEIPVYQGVAFGDPVIQGKLNTMLSEMISRDKNRCGIIIWSMSNETSPGRERDQSIISMISLARKTDPTRLIASAFNKIDYAGNTISITDTLSKSLDVISVNEYLGWYKEWPAKPAEVVWKCDFNKPLILSEFGCEALYGNHGPDDVAGSWSEEYQEKLYKDQLAMFKNIPMLRGTCPWILVDFRSPRRLHPILQDGVTGMWNRKGLISDQGFKKKAWFVMHDFYETK